MDIVTLSNAFAHIHDTNSLLTNIKKFLMIKV